MTASYVVYSPSDAAYGGLWYRVRREDALRSPLVGYCTVIARAVLCARLALAA